MKTRNPMLRWEDPMSRPVMPLMSESKEVGCSLLRVACQALSIVNKPQILTQVVNLRIAEPMVVTHSTPTISNSKERMRVDHRITN